MENPCACLTHRRNFLQLPNVRLVADGLAQFGGYRVFVPDFHNGDSVSHDALDLMVSPAPSCWGQCMQCLSLCGKVPSFISWIRRHDDPSTLPILHKVCEALRSPEHGVTRLGVQGYCWGGRYALVLAASGHADAFLSAHPSGVKVPAEIEPIQRPGCFILAKGDHAFNAAAVRRTRAILEAKAGLKFDFKEYDGVFHGFAVRGRQTVPAIAAARKDALEHGAAFFKSVL
jgi:dienelactone hydrolase